MSNIGRLILSTGLALVAVLVLRMNVLASSAANASVRAALAKNGIVIASMRGEWTGGRSFGPGGSGRRNFSRPARTSRVSCGGS